MDLRVNVLTVAVVIKGPTLNDFSPALNDVFRDEIELTCPLQAVPGSQFTCSIDIPRGNGVKVLLEMRDDIDGTTQVTTPEMAIPGGNIKTNFHILHNYPMILPRSVVGYSRRTPSHIHLRQRELQPHQERPGLPDQPQNVGQHLSHRGYPRNRGQLLTGGGGARVSRPLRVVPPDERLRDGVRRRPALRQREPVRGGGREGILQHGGDL